MTPDWMNYSPYQKIRYWVDTARKEACDTSHIYAIDDILKKEVESTNTERITSDKYNYPTQCPYCKDESKGITDDGVCICCGSHLAKIMNVTTAWEYIKEQVIKQCTKANTTWGCEHCVAVEILDNQSNIKESWHD